MSISTIVLLWIADISLSAIGDTVFQDDFGTGSLDNGLMWGIR